MSKALRITLVVIIVLLIVIAIQPTDFRYSRTITVAAPASASFAQVNDFHKWVEWSPWEKLDPTTKKTYGGAPEGVGATYHWVGNAKVGEGRMIITESVPNELIRITVSFLKPMKATNTIEFTFKEQNGQTDVTQSMFGKNAFMGKASSLFMNMDKMMSENFDEGLAGIKAAAEAK